jgi:hypothetical protein
LAHCKKKKKKKKKFKIVKNPKNRIFYGKMECLPLWPTYIGEKGEDFGQNICDLKRVAIGNTFGEHIGNLENILKNLKGTYFGNKEKRIKALSSSRLSVFF